GALLSDRGGEGGRRRFQGEAAAGVSEANEALATQTGATPKSKRRWEMTRVRRTRFDARPSLYERVMLWLSTSRRIDGLWVGCYLEEIAAPSLDRVEAALRLIKDCDRVRYDRLVRDLDRIWVQLITVGVAQFSASLRACVLDERFVLADTT